MRCPGGLTGLPSYLRCHLPHQHITHLHTGTQGQVAPGSLTLPEGGGSFYQALPCLFLIALVLTKPSALSDGLSISSGQKSPKSHQLLGDHVCLP